MNDQARGLGDNRPPDAFDDLKARAEALIATTNKWLAERPEIADGDMAGRCTDFVEQIGKEWKAIDAERASQKKPYDQAAAAVQSRCRPSSRTQRASRPSASRSVRPACTCLPTAAPTRSPSSRPRTCSTPGARGRRTPSTARARRCAPRRP